MTIRQFIVDGSIASGVLGGIYRSWGRKIPQLRDGFGRSLLTFYDLISALRRLRSLIKIHLGIQQKRTAESLSPGGSVLIVLNTG